MSKGILKGPILMEGFGRVNLPNFLMGFGSCQIRLFLIRFFTDPGTRSCPLSFLSATTIAELMAPACLTRVFSG
jgi:hypothetical protein